MHWLLAAFVLTSSAMAQAPSLESLFGDSTSSASTVNPSTSVFDGKLALGRASSPGLWTILIYMAADNDLDSHVVGDIEEMEQAGSVNGVNIVVLVDRWAQGGEWSDSRVAVIQRAPQPEAQSIELSDTCAGLGEVDMGNPETLTAFLKWGMAEFPAKRYGLVLWNHGGGWRSMNGSRGVPGTGFRGLGFVPTPQTREVCGDWESGNELYTREVREALESSGIRLELLAFDACLMGMFEVAFELRNLSRYFLASEQNIPLEGYEYGTCLTQLVQDPTMDGYRLAEAIITAYDEAYDSEKPDCTLSVVRTAELDELRTRLDNVVKHLASLGVGSARGWSLRPTLEKVRSSSGPEMGSKPHVLPYIDLGVFLQELERAPELPAEAQRAARDAWRAYAKAVPHFMRTEVPERTGLSIFLPRGPEMDVAVLEEYTAENLQFAAESVWPHLLRAFVSDEAPPPLGDPAPVEAPEGGSLQPVTPGGDIEQLF